MDKNIDSYDLLKSLNPAKDFTVLTDPTKIENHAISKKAHPDHVKESLLKNAAEYNKKLAEEKERKKAEAEIANDIEELDAELEDRNNKVTDTEDKIEPITAATISDSAINTKDVLENESSKDNK